MLEFLPRLTKLFRRQKTCNENKSIRIQFGTFGSKIGIDNGPQVWDKRISEASRVVCLPPDLNPSTQSLICHTIRGG